MVFARIAIFLLLVVVYFVIRDFDKIDDCLGCRGDWSYIDVKRKIQNNLWTNKIDGLKIKIPNTKIKAILNDIVSLKNEKYFIGKYTSNEDRGSVYFNANKIHIVKFINKNANIYYVAPFFVSNQGSGIFYYIGLFKYNQDSKTSQHINSIFLGDRIILQNITEQNAYIRVDYQKHSLKQSYTDKPSQKTSMKFGINGKLLQYLP